MDKTVAISATAFATGVVVMKQDMKSAALDAATIGGTNYVADMVFSNPEVSGNTGNFTHIANAVVGAGLYAAVDGFTDNSPMTTLPGKMFYALGVSAIGDRFVRGLLNQVGV